jgi:hypothetical protein
LRYAFATFDIFAGVFLLSCDAPRFVPDKEGEEEEKGKKRGGGGIEKSQFRAFLDLVEN